MVDNDNAGFQNERGALKSIASRLAPTGLCHCVLLGQRPKPLATSRRIGPRLQ